MFIYVSIQLINLDIIPANWDWSAATVVLSAEMSLADANAAPAEDEFFNAISVRHLSNSMANICNS